MVHTRQGKPCILESSSNPYILYLSLSFFSSNQMYERHNQFCNMSSSLFKLNNIVSVCWQRQAPGGDISACIESRSQPDLGICDVCHNHDTVGHQGGLFNPNLSNECQALSKIAYLGNVFQPVTIHSGLQK